MLNFSAGQTEHFLPPIIRREIQIRRPDQVANPAALVGFLDHCVAGSTLPMDSTSPTKHSLPSGASASGEYASRIPSGSVCSPGTSTPPVELSPTLLR